MSKSGLADSPFFTSPQAKNTEVTPLSIQGAEKPIMPTSQAAISDSPTPAKEDVVTSDTQNLENRDQKRSNERTLERPDERSNERLNERPAKQKREKIRHTFDIYRDQLIELQRIQWERVQAGKKKPKLGKMVAEGIDLYIKQQATKKKRA
jgi:hypothetical protein